MGPILGVEMGLILALKLRPEPLEDGPNQTNHLRMLFRAQVQQMQRTIAEYHTKMKKKKKCSKIIEL